MRFRKWIFRVLTGYSLVEYSDMLQLASKVNSNAEKVNKEANELINSCNDLLVLCRKMQTELEKRNEDNETLD